MTPRTYESLQTKLRRLAAWVEEAGLQANIARVRISAAQLPDIGELNRAIEVAGLAEMEMEGVEAELDLALRSEAKEPSEAVLSSALVSLHARWLENAEAMEKLADECDDLDEVKDADECRERMRTLRDCAAALDDILRAGMKANSQMNDLQSELSAFYRDCEQRLAVCEAATAGLTTSTRSDIDSSCHSINYVGSAVLSENIAGSADVGNASREKHVSGAPPIQMPPRHSENARMPRESCAIPDGTQEGSGQKESTIQSTTKINGGGVLNGWPEAMLLQLNFASCIKSAEASANTAEASLSQDSRRKTQGALIMSFLEQKEGNIESKTWLYAAGDVTRLKAIIEVLNSRNQRPGEIRALVKLAKALENAAKERDDDMSECCSAGFYDPGWPDCDICTKCKEHSSPCFTEAAESAQAALREILADWRNNQ